jgi:hypothetical protein
MSIPKKCSVDGCDIKYHAKGFCKKHYEKNRMLNYDLVPCGLKDCSRPHFAKGYCKDHYYKYRITGKVCSIDGCQTVYAAKGYCKYHYLKIKKAELRIYHNMKQRCCNDSNKSYQDYGGRGVKVCNRWLESFDNFLIDMGKRPEGKTLDRIDPDGNYTPENCRWADIYTQAQNRNWRKIPLSGAKNIYKQSNRWLVILKRHKIIYKVGPFNTIEEAVEARQAKIQELDML